MPSEDYSWKLHSKEDYEPVKEFIDHANKSSEFLGETSNEHLLEQEYGEEIEQTVERLDVLDPETGKVDMAEPEITKYDMHVNGVEDELYLIEGSDNYVVAGNEELVDLLSLGQGR